MSSILAGLIKQKAKQTKVEHERGKGKTSCLSHSSKGETQVIPFKLNLTQIRNNYMPIARRRERSGQ
jgi:hypothetical protein